MRALPLVLRLWPPREVGRAAQLRREAVGPPPGADSAHPGGARCVGCHAVAIRPAGLPERVRVFPPGHQILRDRRGRAVGDRCPGLTSA